MEFRGFECYNENNKKKINLSTKLKLKRKLEKFSRINEVYTFICFAEVEEGVNFFSIWNN